MFHSRRRRSTEDPYLRWKVRSFFGGATLAAVGIGTNTSWLVVLAIVVLLIGAGARFLPIGSPEEHEHDQWGSGETDGGPGEDLR